MPIDRTTQLRRGGILLLLRAAYPARLQRGRLLVRLDPWYGEDSLDKSPTLKADLAYLEERGLLDAEISHPAGVKVTTYRLTAQGVNVADKAATDPGVHIEEASE